MRKVLFAAALLFSADHALAVCTPYMAIEGIAGDYVCQEMPSGTFVDFTSAIIGPNSLTVTKRLDKASSKLWFHLVAGQHISSVTLFVPAQQARHRFTHVLVTSINQSAAASAATETVAFQFAALESVWPASKTGLITRTPTPAPSSIVGSTITGGASQALLAIVFAGQPATGWQVNAGRDASGRGTTTAHVQGAAAMPAAPATVTDPKTAVTPLQPPSDAVMHGLCTDLRGADGRTLLRYFFDASIPAPGTFKIEKMQIQFMPGTTTCGPSSSPSDPGWNLGSNTVV